MENIDNLWATSDIARVASVTTQAVGNWRRRYSDFPEPLGEVGGRLLFDKAEVKDWLIGRGKVSG